MPATKARYDGMAEWYHEWSAGWAEANWEPFAQLLGQGAGR